MSNRQVANVESGAAGRTLTGMLRHRARVEPERILYTFVGPGKQTKDVTFRELHEQALGIAIRLRSAGREGDRALLAYPPGQDHIVAFLGCLYARLIPISTALPNVERDRLRAESIYNEASPALILTTTEHLEIARKLFENRAGDGTPCLATDEIGAGLAGEGDFPDSTEDDVAYLQYTSGSTSAPKGVIITHRCLTHNLLNIERGFRHSAGDLSVNWLPHFHDMGLVYGFLQPIFSGFRSVQLSAAMFVRHPIEWLRLISDWKATHSGAPNFAYELCVRGTTEQSRAGLDLRNWRVAFCGAEPIHFSAITDFQRVYSKYGFSREAFCPAYGLAEATLKVSGGEAGGAIKTLGPDSGAAPSGDEVYQSLGKVVVSCGRAGLDTDIRIVDPIILTEQPEGGVGEVWVSGPGVAAGYWNRPEETARTFRAVLSTYPDREYLRTGDLGFIRDEELYVVGRQKDVIIIRGQNYFAEDIEFAVRQSRLGFEPAVAAFSIEMNGEERPVVALERPRSAAVEPAEIIRAVRRSVGEGLGLALHSVAIVGPRQIPLTSSGKVSRSACRKAYLEGALRVILADVIAAARGAADALADEPSVFDGGRLNSGFVRRRLEQTIAALTGIVLNDQTWESPLVSLGIDSLKSAELERVIFKDFGVSLDPVSILSGLTPNDLLRRVLRLDNSGMDEPEAHAGVEPGTERFSHDGIVRTKPSIEQERLWLVAGAARKGALNLGGNIRFRGRLDVSAMRQALRWAFMRHVSLRASFLFRNGALRFNTEDTLDPALPVTDLQTLPADRREARVQELMREEFEFPFDVARAPLVRFHLLVLDKTEFLLTVCGHHLICDYQSFQILASELDGAYAAILDGRQPPSAEPTFDYRRFAEWQREQSLHRAWEPSLSFWGRRLSGFSGSPFDNRSEEDFPMGYARAHETLDAETVRAMRDVAGKHGATPFMVLVATLAVWLSRRCGKQDLVIACPVSGRLAAGAEHAVGLFAYPIPIRIDLSGKIDFDKLLRRVRSSFLASYRHQRVPFSKILEAAAGNGAAPRALARVMCNLFSGEARTDATSGASFEIQRGGADFDLNVTWIEQGDAIRVEVGYEIALLPHEDGVNVAAQLANCIAACVRRPDTPVSVGQESAPEEKPPPQAALVISSSFTGGPIRESLEFWISKFGLDCVFELLPDGQIFQSLLDPSTPIRRNRDGMNALLVRLHDWRPLSANGAGPSPRTAHEEFRKTVREFTEILRTAALSAPAALLVCLCPNPAEAMADPDWSREYGWAEGMIASLAEETPGVKVVTHRELSDLYPVADYADRYKDAIAGAPYTQTFYTSIGTMILRRYTATLMPRPKVIVLDCDNTLWKGVCGEDSLSNIAIDSAAESVQRTALALREAGVLVALCSKNEETDVWNVFANLPGMRLRREHLTAWRINWNSKAANLRELSEAIGVDLGTFAVLDDDPVECAALRASCPEAMVYQLPANRCEAADFLKHLWPLDVAWVTADDRGRAESYQIEALRREAEKFAPSLGEFIAQLRLECEITPVLPAHVDRVAQLTVRTTQMNTNPLGRTPGEVRDFIDDARQYWRAVHVRDRFGDYGLVGVMSFHTTPSALEVDTFLLSCRALGRGIEHRMAQALGAEAEKFGSTEIRFVAASTHRNEPARLFLSALGGVKGHQSWTVQAGRASRLEFDPDRASRSASRREKIDKASFPAVEPPRATTTPAAVWEEIATRFQTPEGILSVIRAPGSASPASSNPAPPSSPTERKIAEVCASLLRIDAIGVDTDFFAAGGDSLLAIELLGSLQRIFNVEMPLANIFNGALTVREIAREVELAVLEQADNADLQEALDELAYPPPANAVRETGGFGG